MDVVAHFGLKAPLFRSEGRALLYTSHAFKAAWTELVDAIAGCETPVVLIGASGTGKTVLVGELTRRLAADGVQMVSFAGPEFVRLDKMDRKSIVILDEADLAAPAQLAEIVQAAVRCGSTLVLVAQHELPAVNSVRNVGLGLMTGTEVCEALLVAAAAAGRPDLFAAAAQSAIVDAVRGMPRALKTLANTALVDAMFDGSMNVEARHVAAAALASPLQHEHPGYEPGSPKADVRQSEKGVAKLFETTRPILLTEPEDRASEADSDAEEIFVPLPPGAHRAQHVGRDARGMVIGIAALCLLVAAAAGYGISVFGLENLVAQASAIVEDLNF